VAEKLDQVRSHLAVQDQASVEDVAPLLGKRRRDDRPRLATGREGALDQPGDRAAQRRVDLDEQPRVARVELPNRVRNSTRGLGVRALAYIEVDGQDLRVGWPPIWNMCGDACDSVRAEGTGRVAGAGEVVGQDQQSSYRR
jgi:hypothetical protein